jgi:hypothetical protein
LVGGACTGGCGGGLPKKVWESPDRKNVIDVSMHLISHFFLCIDRNMVKIYMKEFFDFSEVAVCFYAAFDCFDHI